MENQIVVSENNNLMLMPVANLNTIKQVYQAKKEFIEGILKDKVDYGIIPGSEKKTLLKPGAEKMSSFFNLAPAFEDIEKVEDWTGEQHGGEPFFYYRIRCHMYIGERRIASADGSCNSWEKKYRYRQGTRACPTCGQPAIFKSKDRPEWYCWSKKGGCGAKFPLNDPGITSQETGQVINPDVAEQVNTILKMAQKRALVAVTLIATGTSEYFTQDIEDFTDATFVSESEPVQFHASKPIVVPEKSDLKDVPTNELLKKIGVEPEFVPEASVGNSPAIYSRPMAPESLAHAISVKVLKNSNVTVNDKQIALAASMIETCFAGQEHTDKIRHSVTKYLVGKTSLNDCSGAEVKAILDWLKPVKDSGGAYVPDAMAQKEIQSVWTAALKEAGQEELPLS